MVSRIFRGINVRPWIGWKFTFVAQYGCFKFMFHFTFHVSQIGVPPEKTIIYVRIVLFVNRPVGEKNQNKKYQTAKQLNREKMSNVSNVKLAFFACLLLSFVLFYFFFFSILHNNHFTSRYYIHCCLSLVRKNKAERTKKKLR